MATKNLKNLRKNSALNTAMRSDFYRQKTNINQPISITWCIIVVITIMITGQILRLIQTGQM